MVMERRAVVTELLADRGDAAVVCGLGSPTWDVAAVSPSDRNFYSWGGMGGAMAMGLGLALSRPDLHVIAVTGDGEAMMGVGSFATVAAKQPGNLTILILDNEHYGETGMQPAHTGLGADLAKMAEGAGIADCVTISDEAGLARAAGRFHETGAPKVVVAKVSAEAPPRVMPTRDAVENKLTMRAALSGNA
ncbi:MAG: thiamine pyrophosphate-dependent enzyme [Pseudomonadota bacterium]